MGGEVKRSWRSIRFMVGNTGSLAGLGGCVLRPHHSERTATGLTFVSVLGRRLNNNMP